MTNKKSEKKIFLKSNNNLVKKLGQKTIDSFIFKMLEYQTTEKKPQGHINPKIHST
jgi:hypothetical protein